MANPVLLKNLVVNVIKKGISGINSAVNNIADSNTIKNSGNSPNGEDAVSGITNLFSAVSKPVFSKIQATVKVSDLSTQITNRVKNSVSISRNISQAPAQVLKTAKNLSPGR